MPDANREDIGALLELITDVSARADTSDDIGAVLEFTVDRVIDFLGWQVGTAWRVRSDGRYELVHARDNGNTSPISEFIGGTDGLVFDPGAEVIKKTAGSSFTTVVADISEFQTLDRTRAAARAGLRTAMLVPIWVDNRVMGGLELYTVDRIRVTDDVRRTVEQVAMHLARVIERKEAHEKLEAQRIHSAAILDSSRDAFVAISSTGGITAWNTTAEEMFGWSIDEVLGRPLSEFIVPPRLREAHNQRVRRILQTGRVEPDDRHSEAVVMHRDGRELPVDVIRWVMNDDESSFLCAFIRDLSEQRAFAERLRVNARLDPLTHLSNRTHLINHLCAALERRSTTRGSVAVLYADIDQFRLINESLGHGVGDEVLVAVAARFAAVLEEGDVIARLSADEFAIVREHVVDHNEVTDLAQRLFDSLIEPVQLIDDTVFVTASIGLTYPEAQCSGCTPPNAERLIHAASVAMHHARSTGVGFFERIDAVRCKSTTTRRHMVSDLRRALDQGEFRIHYQPEIRVSDGQIVGVEALLRWMHPENGLQAPAAFIDSLEQSGLIVPVGRWVMEEATRQAREWQDGIDLSPVPLHVWTNVSTRQFAQSDLVSTIDEVLGSAGLDPEKIAFGIELTESSLMNQPEHALTTLHQLRELGLGLAIDDFGTGYSSLAYLKHFPATTLKIDRSFVLGVADHAVDRSIVEGVVALAKSLDLDVVAEGVETDPQLDVLRELGVDLAQGYLFAQPLPAKTMTERLVEQAERTNVLRAIRPMVERELTRAPAIGS